jgi:hypothetical protein
MKIKQLLGIALIALSSAALASGHGAGQGQGHGKDKAHKGMHMLQPMPNLMRVIKHHGDQLELTKDQAANLAKWRELNHDKVHKRMQEMIAIRKALQVAATKGANLAAINVYVAKMDRLRAEIIAAKIACRDNTRSILNDQQWEKLITLYRENYL